MRTKEQKQLPLSPAMIANIASYLTPHEMCTVSATCWQIYKPIAKTKPLWDSYIAALGIEMPLRKGEEESW